MPKAPHRSPVRSRRKPPSVVPPVRPSPVAGPPVHLQHFHQSIGEEIRRLRGQIKTYEALIDELESVQRSIDRVHLTTSPRSHADTAAAILAAHGRPMQLRDLMAAIEAHGVRLTGRTPRNRRTNLIIAMKRSGQFKRLGEGMYTLAAPRAA
jgi:hypothetical protein